jgi:hypothetical protein
VFADVFPEVGARKRRRRVTRETTTGDEKDETNARSRDAA